MQKFSSLSIEDDIEGLKRRYNLLASKNVGLTANINKLNDEIRELQRKKREVQSDISDKYNEANTDIANKYKNKEATAEIKMIFETNSRD